MNTATTRIPKLEESRSRDYVFVLEDFELAFPVWQLEAITKQWNDGMEIEEIAKVQKRNVHEVFFALYQQALNEKITRPFAYRM